MATAYSDEAGGPEYLPVVDSNGKVTGFTPMTGPAVKITFPEGETTLQVYEGQAAEMTITAENATAYQWYVNTGNGWNKIASATEAKFTLPQTVLSQNGYRYACVASKGVNREWSPNYVLEVLKAPDVPETGDSASLTLWRGLMAASLLTCVVMNKKYKKV